MLLITTLIKFSTVHDSAQNIVDLSVTWLLKSGMITRLSLLMTL